MEIYYMFVFLNEKIHRLSHSRVLFFCSFGMNFQSAKLKKKVLKRRNFTAATKTYLDFDWKKSSFRTAHPLISSSQE